MAMPHKLNISKIVVIVNSLAKLHNFCIDEKNGRVPMIHNSDHFYMINNCNGNVSGNSNEKLEDIMTPSNLDHGGEHFDGIRHNILHSQQEEMRSIVLPRTYLFNMITMGQWEWPTRIGNRRQMCGNN